MLREAFKKKKFDICQTSESSSSSSALEYWSYLETTVGHHLGQYQSSEELTNDLRFNVLDKNISSEFSIKQLAYKTSTLSEC